MDITWGICHHAAEPGHVTLLTGALKSIRKYYDHPIIVVSSDHAWREQSQKSCDDFGAVLSDHLNVNYECGAWKYILDNHTSDFWCFMQDSVQVNGRIDYMFDRNITLHGMFETWTSAGAALEKSCIESLKGTPWENVPNKFAMAEGNMVFAKDEVLRKIWSKGFFDILPTNKGESMMWERRLGIALSMEGYEEEMRQLTGRKTPAVQSEREMVLKKLWARRV